MDEMLLLLSIQPIGGLPACELDFGFGRGFSYY
jgi:hypothetical protein